jgi:hypothetical protein
MRTNRNSYDSDVVAWANEQARLLRAGCFDALDIEHIADEIEDVGKSEQRELASRMAVLLAHLLKWRLQPIRRGASWEITVRNQRKAIALHLKQVPSLKAKLSDSEWWEVVWGDAISQAARDTGIGDFPESCHWTFDQIMNPEFWPASLD